MKITIHGEPIPKARPRFFTKGGHKLAFNSQSTQESEFAWKLAKARNEAKFDHLGEQYEISLRFFFRPPPGKDANEKLWGLIPHTGRPDLDNLEKFVLDCANGVLYHDDAQITRLSSTKHYCINPRTEIVILSKMQPDVTPEIKQLVKYCSPKDLEEITQDVQLMQKILSSSNLADTDNLENVSLGRLQPAAESLIRFGKKWGGVLSKIAK